jgi:hypothetical protein
VRVAAGGHVLEVKAEFEIEAEPGAFGLGFLNCGERTAPLAVICASANSELRCLAPRIDAHENLRDLFVGQLSLQHVHSADVLPDAS